MDAYNVAKAVAVSLPVGWMGWVTQEGATALAKHLQPDRIIFFSTVDVRHADEPNFGESEAARVHECVRNGAQGIKLYFAAQGHPCSCLTQGLAVNDKRMLPIYEACGELNIPLLLHVGRDEAVIAQLADAAKKCRKAIFIAAHAMGHGLEPDFVAARLRENPNLYIDASAPFARPDQPEEIVAARKFFLDHAERIVFGTDPVMSFFRPGALGKWRDLKLPQARNTFEGRENGGLNLPDDVLEKMYSENINRLIGQWNPVRFEYFKLNLQQYVHALEDYLLHPIPGLTEGAPDPRTGKVRIAMAPGEIEHFLAFARKWIAS
ncbi:MAG: amidohydrolase family protein [Candidatus Sumerlaeota bacterium]|nr:amidohydrolase family protein [Candidatus Sumerlaeota bacterium]